MLIDVLGPVRLGTDDGAPVEVAERQLRLLLTALVAAAGEPVPAETMIERLWRHEMPNDPRKVLQAKLSRLRAGLDRARAGAGKMLTNSPAGYRLTIAPDDLDAERFRKMIQDARRMDVGESRVSTLGRALDLWRGDPFGDAGEQLWLAPVVAELRALRADAVETLVETLVRSGEPYRALALAAGHLDDLATREGLVGWQMTALYRVGRQQEALATFEALRHRLAEELGVDPEPRLRELHGRILRQDPALSAPEPRAGPLSGTASVAETQRGDRRTNLPAETDSLIGRSAECADVDALLADSRLVTLTGTGGVGKTRLALHLARGHEDDFDRGVWFVDLSELTGTADGAVTEGRIASLTATAMGLPEAGSPIEALDQLVAALGARTTLLVLDNAEHLIEEASQFTDEMLRRAAGARLLITSREPLGLPVEQRYHLDMLSTRPGVAPSAEERLSDAATFFVTRARAIDRSLELDDDMVGQIEQLCRRLDGLPLALELAASRIKVLTVGDLLERLDDRLSLLGRPGRAAPPRQRTLRGMIDWSWSLLDDSERAVLRRLAVHPGSIDLAAAEVICSDQTIDRAAVTEILFGLVERSLVTAFPGPSGMRYGLLESIASYASEKLDLAEERQATAARHLNHYSEFCRDADAGLRTRRQRHWLSRFAAERTQLDHAFEQAIRAGEGHRATMLILARFWRAVCVPGFATNAWTDGYRARLARELRTVLDLPGLPPVDHASLATLAACLSTDAAEAAAGVDRALGEFDADPDSADSPRADTDVAKARVEWFAGATLLLARRRHAGEEHIDNALAILDEHHQYWDLAVAVSRRDWLLITLWREPPRGLADGREAGELLRGVDDGYGRLHDLAVEHRTAELIGDHRRSAAAVSAALDLSCELDIASEIALWLTALAIDDIRRGDNEAALRRLTRAREIAAEIGFAVGAGYADLAESMIERMRPDADRARDLMDRWLRSPAASDAELLTHFESGFLAIRQGAPRVAAVCLVALIRCTTKKDDWPTTARMLELAAAVTAADGDGVRASELLGTAAAVRDRADVAPSVIELVDIEGVRSRVAESLSSKGNSAATICSATLRGAELDPVQQLAHFAASTEAAAGR